MVSVQTTRLVLFEFFIRFLRGEGRVFTAGYDLVADGEANKEVAVNLEIAERTVKNHMANILEKLPARSRAHAVRLAVENRWICQSEQTDEAELLELVA